MSYLINRLQLLAQVGGSGADPVLSRGLPAGLL